MQLNKGLNLDGLPDTVDTGDYRYAENVVLDNTFKLPTNENGLKSLMQSNIEINISDIAGTIYYDKGIIFFHKIGDDNYISQLNTNTETITKKINLKQNIIFDKHYPIRGTYTYNQNEHLVIIFSCGVDGLWEDKIIDIDAYTDNYELTLAEIYNLDINPNIQFPNITNQSIAGSLLTGSYQIAVSYKIDNEYSNYSLLSLPFYVYGHNTDGDGKSDGLKPNVVSTEGIKYLFANLDTNYKYYKIAVIFNEGITFKVYTTSDILTTTNNYDITDLGVLEISTLNDVLINSIFYSNSETLTVMNNKLYRANLKGQNIEGFDTVAQQLASLVSIDLKETVLVENDFTNIKSKQFIKFQNDEVYALYLTLGDKKGNVIGSYPINSINILSDKISNYSSFITNNILVEQEEIQNPYTIHKEYIENTPTITKTKITQDVIHTLERTYVYPIPITYSFDENLGKVTVTASETYIEDLLIEFNFKYTNDVNEEAIYPTTITLLANTLTVDIIYTLEEIPDYQSNGRVDPIITNLNVSCTANVLLDKDIIVRFYKDGLLFRTENVLMLQDTNSLVTSFDLNYYDIYTIEHNIFDICNYTVSFLTPLILPSEVTIVLNQGVPPALVLIYLYNIGEQTHTFVDDTLNNPTYAINLVDPQAGVMKIWITTPYVVDVVRNITLNVNNGADFIQIPTILNSTISEIIYTNYTNIDIIVSHSPIDSLNRIRYKYTLDYPAFEDFIITNTLKNNTTFLQTLITNVSKYQQIIYSNYVAKYLNNGGYLVINNNIVTTNIPVEYPENIENYYTIYKENNGADGDIVKYTTNYIEITLPATAQDILGSHYNNVGFWCIHRALRTNTNSKIYCQGLITAQVLIGYNFKLSDNYSEGGIDYEYHIPEGLDPNMFLLYSNPQDTYKQQLIATAFHTFKGYEQDYSEFKNKNDVENEIRFYSFEDAFSKLDYFPINKLNILNDYNVNLITNNLLLSNINNILTAKKYTSEFDINSARLVEGNNLNSLNYLLESSRILNIDNNNLLFRKNDANYLDRTKLYRVNVHTQSENYYSHIYDETLVLSSTINKIENNIIKSIGDTF